MIYLRYAKYRRYRKNEYGRNEWTKRGRGNTNAKYEWYWKYIEDIEKREEIEGLEEDKMYQK